MVFVVAQRDTTWLLLGKDISQNQVKVIDNKIKWLLTKLYRYSKLISSSLSLSIACISLLATCIFEGWLVANLKRHRGVVPKWQKSKLIVDN